MRLNVGTRLMLVFTLVIVIVTGSIAYYASTAFKNEIIKAAEQKLDSDLNMGLELLDQKYPGQWSIGSDGKLYKGDVLMDENFEIVDLVGEKTGDTCTIFKGDTRVSTNVKANGVRKVGTQCAPEVAQAVLKEGQKFVGEADVAGTRNLTTYVPLKDAQGKIIGMFYVGVPATPYDEMAGRLARNMLWGTLIGIVLAGVAAFLLSRSVAGPLQVIEESIQRAAEGDLTRKVEMDAKDEIGRVGASLNVMIDKISSVIAQTQRLAQNVAGVSGQLKKRSDASARLMERMSASCQEMADNAVLQMDMAQQTRDIIKEMSAGIQQVAVGAQESSSASVQASKTAEEGGIQVEQVVRQMEVISSTVNSTAGIVQGLGEKSQRIGEIVDVITGIAEQTNLLALNAAIEAARAGEQGRGFAVVAEEVRKLAEESAEAAKKIAVLIGEIQQEAGRAVKAMDDGTREVANGIQVVAKSGMAFQGIIDGIKKISEHAQEVSAASEEMAAGTDTALQAVNRTAEAAQNTTDAAKRIDALAAEQLAGLQEVNASAEELNRVIAELEKSIELFKVAG